MRTDPAVAVAGGVAVALALGAHDVMLTLCDLSAQAPVMVSYVNPPHVVLCLQTAQQS